MMGNIGGVSNQIINKIVFPEDSMGKYKLIFEHFKQMEKRYHTWMNYYSLFNGALLVAYCTILVSTGKIVELEGGSVNDVAKVMHTGAKVFYLDCTYWNMLTLISLLGVLAAYAWYLSIIGHYYWIDSWRKLIQKEDKDNGLGIENRLGGITYETIPTVRGMLVMPHFYSTFKITRIFIWGVLFAWIYVLGYSGGNHTFNLTLIGFTIASGVFLICLEYDWYRLWIASDLTGFTNEDGKSLKGENSKGGDKTKIEDDWGKTGKVIRRIIIFLLIFSILGLGYCVFFANTDSSLSYCLQMNI